MKMLPQAIILAAGHSSRVFPYTDLNSHKSMIEIGGKPILEYVLEGVKKSGCKEAIIVVNKKKSGISDYFRDGKKIGLSIKYVMQKKPKGMGDALLSAKPYIQDNFFIINPNQVNVSEFLPLLARAFTSKYEGVLLGRKTKEPWRYGVFQLRENKILQIIEKPARGKEPSNVYVVGIYLLRRDFLKVLSKTPRTKSHLETALNTFCKENNVRLLLSTKETFSLKYPWDLLRIKEFLGKRLKSSISSKALVSAHAVLQGPVVVEEGAHILEGAVLKGPVYIGKNAFVGNHTLIRSNTFLEEGARIGAMSEVRNSLFMKNSSFHTGFVGDSIVGENTKIGAGLVTANRRFDRGEISTYINKKKTPTGYTSLGALIGHNVSIGIKCGTMPGVMIGSGSIVYPGTIVYKNVQGNTVIKRKGSK